MAAAARVTMMEMAVLAGHLLLYPTGVLQEPPPPALVPRQRTAPPAVAQPSGPPHAPHAPYAPSGPPRPSGRTPVAGPVPAPVPVADIEARTGSGADGQLPVLLLHGFVDNRSVFTPLRRNLRRHGWRQVSALNYSPLTSDVRHAAALLGRHVEELCERTGSPRIDLVGHSLGGLIGRYYAQRLGGDVRVRTLVTLATPHAGTRAVPFADPHPVVRQMRPHSALMAELALPAPDCRTRFIAFWSDADHIMAPTESARIDHPDLIIENIGVHGVGHLAMAVNAQVVAGVRQALRGDSGSFEAVDAA
ncbi:alpha/beta fold hydrolase [Streptomyces sp. ICBB 8177]|uniref:alpha/beta fold hydrolase n=1 Tax=Streptomyces sp. ICBB 8177 TaxID=563922 RepID=UPI0018EEBA91|nr:alpha/beta fold hydrolase [Streptomyces sp. ICBB 8177]